MLALMDKDGHILARSNDLNRILTLPVGERTVNITDGIQAEAMQEMWGGYDVFYNAVETQGFSENIYQRPMEGQRAPMDRKTQCRRTRLCRCSQKI